MSAIDAVECPHCAARIRIKSESILGKKVTCPKCSEPFVAKAAGQGSTKTEKSSAAKSSAADSTEPVAVACPHCDAKFRVRPTALGKSRSCPKCSEEFTPRAAKSSAAKRPKVEAKEADDTADDEDFMKSLSAAAKDSRTADVDEESESDDAEDSAPSRSKTKSSAGNKKKKKSSSSSGSGFSVPGILGWIIGGTIGGTVGAGIWVAVGYFSGFEVGWIAWGVGFLAGMGTGVAAAANDEQGTGSGITAAVISILAVLAGKYAVLHLIMEQVLGQLPAEARKMAEAAKGDIFLASFGPYDLLWFFLAAGTAYKLGSGQQEND